MPSPQELSWKERHDYGAKYSTPKPGTPPPMPGMPMPEIRLRMPRRNEREIFATVIELKGGNHLTVHCEDGKDRMCRIPGKIRKRLWIKDNDYVLVKPWEVQGDEKCDLVYRYTNVQVDALKRRGILKM